jgi:hypothetical protein
MANPFDQFDGAPVAPTAPGAVAKPDPNVPQPAIIKPGQNPEEVAAAAAPVGGPVDASNPFNDPDAAMNQGMSNEEFSSALYDKLNAGESVPSLVKWSKEVGHEIIPDEKFQANVRIRDEALRSGKKGSYGRVNSTEAGQAPPTDALGAAGSFIRQAGNAPLFNFGDEAAAAMGAIPAWMQGKDYGEAYNELHQDFNTQNDIDWAVRPGVSGAGALTGALLAGRVTPSIMNAPRVAEAGLAARSAAGAAEGAAYGAATATGDGRPGERFTNTGAGATVGGMIGGATSPAIAAIARIGRPIIERMVPNEARALAKRLGYEEADIAAAEQRLAEQRGAGVNDSTLLDVLDEPGRSVVGSAGAKGPAREELQDFALARETQLPERVAGASEEIVAPAASRELGVSDDVRSGIADQRDAEISAAMEAEIAPGLRMRDAPVSLSPDIADTLGTTLGQKAIREVINETTDAATREQLAQLQAIARNRARSRDPRLSEEAQQAAQEAADGALADAPFTIGLSERLGRKLNAMGRTTGNGALFDFGRTVRGAAEQSPAYRQAMSRYSQMSGYAEAPSVGSGVKTVMDDTGRVTKESDEGLGFLQEPSVRFETRVGNLDSTPMQNAEGRAMQMPDGTPAPSEVDLARLGASEQVAVKAGAGPGAAKDVAKKLYDSPEQRARSVALLGEQGADRLATRMREEVERVYRAARQATKEGPAKEAGLAAVESGVNMAYNPGPVSFIRETARFLRGVGMTERDALWVVRNATDPAQTEAILTRLRRQGMDDMRAQATVDQLRDSAVRYFTSNEEN